MLLMSAGLIYLCGRNRALSEIIHPKRGHPQSGDSEGKGIQDTQVVPKHMSGMSMVSPRPESDPYRQHSPALPGYIGPYDGVQLPPSTHYAPSDALSPATPILRSASPGLTVVPAYTRSPPLASHTL